MKIITWNVNGIRAAHKKGFIDFIRREDPDIFCVQETKAHREQCEPALQNPLGRSSHWASAIRKGYSGVATFCKESPIEAHVQIGESNYDNEGRIVITKHQGFSLYNIYFPNGGSGEERHLFKQGFLKFLNAHLKERLANQENIILVGDYNVAHQDSDVFDPVRLQGESGFLPEERKWFSEFLNLGFVDCFRHFYPNRKEIYTWWSMIERARISNRGWRIDYICVSRSLVPQLKSCEILDQQEGSDHCPVVLELK